MKIYFVDAFTNEKFKGNPAAVCYLEKQISNTLKQQIAKEIGFSETAFIQPLNVEENKYSLQWFTPVTEINLCGHATLSSAKILFTYYLNHQSPILFESKSGILKASLDGDAILLDFPVEYAVKSKKDYLNLGKLIGIETEFECYECPQTANLMFVVQDESELRSLRPDYERLIQLDISPFSSVCVTAPGLQPFDFVSRCFAPWEGINEDPVTGSTHTFLTPYWSEIFQKTSMKARQLSERSGELELDLSGER
nr:PhzF family phenazine biosynthesis protein [Candidatus Cloacimonadota bacterium]